MLPHTIVSRTAAVCTSAAKQAPARFMRLHLRLHIPRAAPRQHLYGCLGCSSSCGAALPAVLDTCNLSSAQVNGCRSSRICAIMPAALSVVTFYYILSRSVTNSTPAPRQPPGAAEVQPGRQPHSISLQCVTSRQTMLHPEPETA